MIDLTDIHRDMCIIKCTNIILKSWPEFVSLSVKTSSDRGVRILSLKRQLNNLMIKKDEDIQNLMKALTHCLTTVIPSLLSYSI